MWVMLRLCTTDWSLQQAPVRAECEHSNIAEQGEGRERGESDDVMSQLQAIERVGNMKILQLTWGEADENDFF